MDQFDKVTRSRYGKLTTNVETVLAAMYETVKGWDERHEFGKGG